MTTPNESVDLYGATYGGFARDVYRDVRREAWGSEIGQNSWLTLEELERFSSQLALAPASRVLDIGCGSGGPALHLARSIGCTIVGVDANESGVGNAARLASETGLDARARFVCADAAGPLPFEAASFQAVLCIDAVNHLRDRPRVFAEWDRLLAPAGRLLFTDPITVTGPLGSDEIAIRASIGFFLFVPPGVDERLLEATSLRLLSVEDATDNMAAVAERWYVARATRADALTQIEGQETFDGQQRFLEVAARLARERRLSRFVYLAEKRG